jgi:HicB family
LRRIVVAVEVGADDAGSDCRVEQAVDEFIAGREAADEDVPVPLNERQYSGKFVVRTSPALHARLEALSAADWPLRLVISHTPSFPKRVCPKVAGADVADGALRAQKPAPWTSCPGVSTISPR